MKFKQIAILLVISVSASLSSCIVPNSQDPVGDSFKRTGDAIGKVVNSVANAGKPVTQPLPQTQAPPHNYPQPQPYTTPQR